MKTKLVLLALFISALPGLSVLRAALPGLKVTRITSRTPGDYRFFGASCAITDRFVVIGEPGTSSLMSPASKGAAHVYDAASGAPLRTLVPKDGALRDCFGSKVCVRGTQALVAADPYDQGAGSVYLFDLATGVQLKKFTAPVPATQDRFGCAIAFSDNLAVVGASGTSSYAGKVYVFDLSTGQLKAAYENAVANSRFGQSLCAQDGTVVIGAPGLQSNKGGIYLLDLLSGNLVLRQSSAQSAGDFLGSSIALTGRSLFIGAGGDTTPQGTNSGSIYWGNLHTSLPSQGPSLLPPGTGNQQSFGQMLVTDGGWLVATDAPASGAKLLFYDIEDQNSYGQPKLTIETDDVYPGLGSVTSVGLAANRLVISGWFGMGQGQAFIVQTLPNPDRSYFTVQRGHFAPGAGNSTYNTFLQGIVGGSSSEPSVMSGLAGLDSHGGKDVGIWSGDGTLMLKTQEDLGNGLRVSTIASMIHNNNGERLMEVTLAGTGVTAANNRAYLCGNDVSLLQMLRTGSPVGALGSVAGISQVVQCYLNDFVTSSLTLKPGINGVSVTNDSAIVVQKQGTAEVQASVREGGASPVMGINYGQMAPRVSHYEDLVAFTSALSGPATGNHGLFTINPMMAGSEKMIARRGDVAPGAGGAQFGTIVAETANYDMQTIFRATLGGAGVTAANNEGIWLHDGNASVLVARKGSTVQHLTALKWSRFVHVWPMAKDEVVLRAVLAGPGLTAANDEGLFLLKKDGSSTTLLREGDLAPGCYGARVASLLAVEVIPNTYAAMVVLGGCPASTNVALLAGSTSAPPQMVSQIRPNLILRKGEIISSPYGATTRITSMAFGCTKAMDASGVGGKGLAASMDYRAAMLRLTCSDGSTRMGLYYLDN